MKKTLLTLILTVAAGFTAFADTSLAQAYEALSKLSGMTEVTGLTVQVDPSSVLTNVKSSAIQVAPCETQKYRDSFVWMMENLPVRNMVIGANNQRELAVIYSTPASKGLYNVLILEGNTPDGTFIASYGQTTKVGVDALAAGNLYMDAGELTMVTSSGENAHSFISMSE